MSRRRTTKSAPREIHRTMKRDALEQNRLDGCRCPGVKARVVAAPTDDEPARVTVLTDPHRNDCPLRVASAEVTTTDTAHPLAVPPRTRDTSGLWTP